MCPCGLEKSLSCRRTFYLVLEQSSRGSRHPVLVLRADAWRHPIQRLRIQTARVATREKSLGVHDVYGSGKRLSERSALDDHAVDWSHGSRRSGGWPCL